jgi:probable addiction module antidote protein
MPKRSRKYEIGLAKRLSDRRHAVNYLNAAADDSDETFLMALKDVAEAQKGMTRVSADAHVNRENLYRMLSRIGNPRYSSFCSVLKALRLKFRVEDNLGSFRSSLRTTTKPQIAKEQGLRDLSRIGQMAFRFAAANNPCGRPSASGMGTLTINAGPLTANAAAMVTSFGSEQSSIQTEAGRYFSLNSRQGHSQNVIGNIFSVTHKAQREEDEPSVLLNYASQLPAPNVPLRELTR